jgi:hypothetical protein
MIQKLKVEKKKQAALMIIKLKLVSATGEMFYHQVLFAVLKNVQQGITAIENYRTKMEIDKAEIETRKFVFNFHKVS